MILARRLRPVLQRSFFCVALLLHFSDQLARADDQSFTPAGTHTVGITVGPFFPIRLLPEQSSKLFGVAAMPSWSIALTDPIGSSWYQGQIAFGAEVLALGTSQPVSATGIGVTPKLLYTLTNLGRLHPFVEGGGGPLWTDLGGRVPEQSGQYNFVVWAGGGFGWSLTHALAIQAGYRFIHISNAGTRSPNSGLNAGLPFVGLSYAFLSRR